MLAFFLSAIYTCARRRDRSLQLCSLHPKHPYRKRTQRRSQNHECE
ncbi:hypothetical protein C4K22_5250 [Pseudomonas chlororaphis subsp. aurantiaca]|nr:hypothetical protein C4K22_5250 [Pseudomonas chlororaphis subsp. aurantiaca]AZD44310.1 hypothetical protein C4K21_5260 [Pseudomonas chlororaphis subsp. aurantiaca]AZD56866.1 hypothetical protein C4K19_5103 [Pseudomonas chlororaphis subsp. aurantiaca]